MKSTLALLAAMLVAALWLWQSDHVSSPVTKRAVGPGAADLRQAQAETLQVQSESMPEPGAQPTNPERQAALAAASQPGYCSFAQARVLNEQTREFENGWVCIPNKDLNNHAYNSYPNEALETMTYGDAQAAEVLGLRKLMSEDPAEEAEGLQLLIRSAAIAGSTRALALAVNERYGTVSTNGEVVLENVKTLFMLSRIAAALGPNGLVEKEYRQLLEENGVAAEEIKVLADFSDRILDDMAIIQSETTGNTFIREAIDAKS